MNTENYLLWRLRNNTPESAKGELTGYWSKYGGLPAYFYDCEDCKETFPKENRFDKGGLARVNGRSIIRCPYCNGDPC